MRKNLYYIHIVLCFGDFIIFNKTDFNIKQ